MTEYDAGPGEWSDRPWEKNDKKQGPHARRRRLALPPWALLVILVAIIIALCVGTILIVQAIRGGGDETPTPAPTATRAEVPPTFTSAPAEPTGNVPPTATVVLPIGTTEATAAPLTEIGPGALVVVQGTEGRGLNLRAEPSTTAQIVITVREGTVLTVLEGPREANGLTWWKMREPGGKEGWGAADWIVLQEQ